MFLPVPLVRNQIFLAPQNCSVCAGKIFGISEAQYFLKVNSRISACRMYQFYVTVSKEVILLLSLFLLRSWIFVVFLDSYFALGIIVDWEMHLFMPYLQAVLEQNGQCELICFQHICRKAKLESVFSQMITLRIEKDKFYTYCGEK